MDRHLYGNDGTFPDASSYYPYLPLGNWSNVVEDWWLSPYSIPTLVPFLLWVISGSFCFLFLGLAAVSTLLRRRISWLDNSSALAFVAFTLNMFPFMACFVAIGLFNSRVNKILTFTPDSPSKFTNQLQIGHNFLFLAWTSVVLLGASTLLAYFWCRKRNRGRNRTGEIRCVDLRETGQCLDDPPPAYEEYVG